MRGTALIETAIVLPLYLLLLLGIVYFGYEGLTMQRQAVASAYEAWQPSGVAQAVDLLSDFWPWAGTPSGTAAVASAGDTTLSLPENRTRSGDEYYAMEMYRDPSTGAVQWIWPGDPNYQPWPGNDQNHIIFVPSQLAAGAYSLEGSKDTANVFDAERVTVELWNYALGHVVQSFNWTPQGVSQQMNTTYDDFSHYLNINFPNTSFVAADAADPPVIGPYQRTMAGALNGPPGGAQWFQRQTVLTEASYQPPFFPQIAASSGAPPSTSAQYFSLYNLSAGNSSAPSAPTTALRFDVTGRAGTANSVRLAAGETDSSAAPQTSAAVLGQLARFMLPMNSATGALQDPDGNVDNQSLGAIGPNGQTMTMQQAWAAW